jgi:hypothetical protein
MKSNLHFDSDYVNLLAKATCYLDSPMKNEPLCHARPIARSLGRIGDSWSIMILRDAFAGFTRFDEFQKQQRRAQYSVAPPEGTGRRRTAGCATAATTPRYEYHTRAPRFPHGAAGAGGMG